MAPPASGTLPSRWKWVDDARARDVWDSINAGRRVFVELRPEDIYGRDGLSLECTNVTPIFAAMAVYIGRPGDTVNDRLNSDRWTRSMRAETRMVFPSIDGQRALLFSNKDWLRKAGRFLYGREVDALDVFQRIGQTEKTSQGLSPYDTGLFGISPFTRFVVEPTMIKGGDGKQINLANPIVDQATSKGDATALMLILELETRNDDHEVKGVLTCAPQN